MKKFSSFALLAMTVLLLASCGSTKNIPYFQNSDSLNSEDSKFLYDARIMPKDLLTITVSTVNPEAAAPFNQTIPTPLNLNTRSSYSQPALQTYLVDNYGFIEFPIIGSLNVSGLTKSACEKIIHDKIQPYMNANENPVVTVRMANYKISVLGEVARPGMYQVNNEKINVLEALAQAGDLTIYGVRENIKLIREDSNGRKEMHTLDLTDANIVSSPYYYLQQNDILYVEPNKVKSRNSNIGTSTTLWFTGTSILISLTSLLYNILK